MPEIIFKENKEEKEKWYMSRRVWGSVLSCVTVISLVAFPAQAAVIGVVASTVAGVLGLRSWVVPKPIVK